MDKNKLLLKRITLGVGSLLLLVVMAIVLIPLFVNIDNYRPQVVAVINENINGKAAIGRMSLSLWGQIAIDIDDVHIQDAQGHDVVRVKQTYAQIPFLSVLSGTPVLVFKVKEPQLNIVKDKQGKLNVLGLIKPQQEVAQTQAKKANDTPSEGDIPFMSMIRAAGLNVELARAKLKFSDLSTGFTQDVNDFNMRLDDISMSRPMRLNIWADIATSVGESVKVAGPVKLNGEIRPRFDQLNFREVEVELTGVFDELDIKVGEVFRKAEGVPMNFQMAAHASLTALDLNKFNFKFHNAELAARGRFDKIQEPNPVINFKVDAKPIALKSWDKLIPLLREFELEGSMTLGASAQGPLNKLGYAANLAIKDLLAEAPGLAVKPKMQLAVNVATDEIKSLTFDLAAPNNDLSVRASLKSFTAPKLSLTVKSDSLNLDTLLPAQNQATEPAKPAPNESAAKTASTPGPDFDAQLDVVRNSDILKKMVGNIAVRIKRFQGFKIVAQELSLDFLLQDLVANVQGFSVMMWRGWIKTNASVDLKPRMPTYNLNASITNVDIKSAVESQLPSFKNTILGRVNVRAQGNGRSINPDNILRNFNLTGELRVTDAQFATIDVGPMVVEALNSALKDVVKKIPGLQDKSIESLKDFKSRYKLIGGDFSLRSGVFLSQNFATEAMPNEGIDLKGKTQVDLINDKLSAEWMVIDTYNVTKAQDIDVNISGFKIPHILARPKQPVSFPVVVGCKLSAPCYQYTSVPKHIGDVALENTRASMNSKQNAAAKEKATKEIKKTIDKEKDKLLKRFGF